MAQNNKIGPKKIPQGTSFTTDEEELQLRKQRLHRQLENRDEKIEENGASTLLVAVNAAFDFYADTISKFALN